MRAMKADPYHQRHLQHLGAAAQRPGRGPAQRPQVWFRVSGLNQTLNTLDEALLSALRHASLRGLRIP